jgi:ankyrin repeat protein
VLCSLFAMAEAARLLDSADFKSLRSYFNRGYDCSVVENSSQSTLLHLVMRLPRADCDKASSLVKCLTKAGGPVNARDADGMTPLMRCRHAALAAVLLDHSADVNACSSGGITCLMHAVVNHDVPMLKLLFSRGASTEARDASGKTALYKACTTCAPVIAHILLDAGACAADQLLLHAVLRAKHAAEAQLQHLSTLLLFAPAQVNETDADGATPLMECIWPRSRLPPCICSAESWR